MAHECNMLESAYFESSGRYVEMKIRISKIMSAVVSCVVASTLLIPQGTGIVKKCAVGEYPKSWIVRYQAA